MNYFVSSDPVTGDSFIIYEGESYDAALARYRTALYGWPIDDQTLMRILQAQIAEANAVLVAAGAPTVSFESPGYVAPTIVAAQESAYALPYYGYNIQEQIQAAALAEAVAPSAQPVGLTPTAGPSNLVSMLPTLPSTAAIPSNWLPWLAIGAGLLLLRR